MATIYIVAIKENSSNFNLIANGREELTKKLTDTYALSKEQIEELVVTKFLTGAITVQMGVISQVLFQLDSTEV